MEPWFNAFCCTSGWVMKMTPGNTERASCSWVNQWVCLGVWGSEAGPLGPNCPVPWSSRNLQKTPGSCWVLGDPGMYSCFGDFVLTLAFFSSKGTSIPGVLKCTGENTGVQRMAVIQKVPKDTDGNSVLCSSHPAQVGSWTLGILPSAEVPNTFLESSLIQSYTLQRSPKFPEPQLTWV